MKRVTVIIKPDGSTEISVLGVKGQSCKDLTRNLELALGQAESSTPTAEMYQHDHTHLRHQAGR